MPHHALLTKGLKGHKASGRSKGPCSATPGFTSFSGVVSSKLPEGWQLRRLGEIVEHPQYGLTASATGEPKGPRFLRITDIQESGVAWRTVPYCECDADSVERLRLRPGDVVVARIGATTGKAYLIRDQVDAVFASYLIRLRATDRLVPDFLAFFTNSAYYWRQIDSVKGGRLKQGINIPLLESLEIPLPPLAEQRAIAEALRTVQWAKEATKKVIAATRQLKASLMKHLFTYGPVPLSQTEVCKSTDMRAGPQHWQSARLREMVADGPQNGLYKPQTDYGDGTQILRIDDYPNAGGVVTGAARRVALSAGEERLYGLRPGDLLINRVNSLSHLGKTALVGKLEEPVVYESNMMRFSVERRKVLPEFLYRFLCLEPTREAMRGMAKRAVAQSSINQGDVSSLSVPLPPLGEQGQIAMQLEAVDAKLAAEEKRRAALAALFQSLLHHLMTGKVRLPEFVISN